jgi:hypothetical protein
MPFPEPPLRMSPKVPILVRDIASQLRRAGVSPRVSLVLRSTFVTIPPQPQVRDRSHASHASACQAS